MNGEADRLTLFEQHRIGLFTSHGLDDASAVWFSDSEGHRTAAVVGGEGQRPVLLLHGAMSDAGEWALVAGRLEGRLVIPDWPGSGLSDPVPIRAVGLRRFGVEWLTALVDALGVEQVDIVGSSAGGYLGAVFALAHPERVHQLVQVGSLPALVRGGPFIFRLLATPGLGGLLLRRQPKSAEANRKQVFSSLVAHPQRIPVDMLEHDLAATALPNATVSAIDFCRALLNPLTGIRPSLMLDRELAALRTPTLYVWGNADNFLKPDRIGPVLKDATAVQLRTVEDCGHLLTLEAPEVVANSINKFLSNHA